MPRLSNAEPVLPAEAGTLTRIFMERTSYRPDRIASAKNFESDPKSTPGLRPHVPADPPDEFGLLLGRDGLPLVAFLIGLQRELPAELRQGLAERVGHLSLEFLDLARGGRIERLLQAPAHELEQDLAVVGPVEAQVAVVGPGRRALGRRVEREDR